jgi:hypothetical protein
VSKEGPETRLVKKMRAEARRVYGARQVLWKNHGSEFSESGLSDVTGTIDGVFVAIEVKAPESYGGSVERALEKGPTVKQRIFVDKVRKAGGIGGFAATVEQFMDLLADAAAMVAWEEAE